MEELILKEREIKEKLVVILNESKLPAFILKSMIKDLYDQINQLEQQKYAQELNNKKDKEEAKE